MTTDPKFTLIHSLVDQILAETNRLVQVENTSDMKSDVAFDVFTILSDLQNKVTDMIQSPQ